MKVHRIVFLCRYVLSYGAADDVDLYRSLPEG